MTPRLVGVDERARALDARPGVDDLVAVNLTATALDLVLRAKRKLGRCRDRLFHAWIVCAPASLRKT
jgi:hypothetical protein